MKSLVVLSGAGVSADSGLATFRDSGGLWEGYDIREVASIEGWRRDPAKVLQFYNLRREQASSALPNAGHNALTRLEAAYRVTIITQNVDDLHERAGSTNVLHLHGELRKARSSKRNGTVVDIGSRPIQLGDLADDGSQLRPHIVWFGEEVPMIEKAAEVVSEAEVFLVIGTSLSVYPAAGLIDLVPALTRKIVIDPGEPGPVLNRGWRHIRMRSSEGTPIIVDELLRRPK